MATKDPEVEQSPLSGLTTRDGITVDVQIYRLAVGHDGWTLDVVDHEGGHSVWEETFETDTAAYAAFEQVVVEDGIESFVDARPDDEGATLH